MCEACREEMRLVSCPKTEEERAATLLEVRKRVAQGARRIVIYVPRDKWKECSELVQALYSEFIYLSVEVYEERG